MAIWSKLFHSYWAFPTILMVNQCSLTSCCLKRLVEHFGCFPDVWLNLKWLYPNAELLLWTTFSLYRMNHSNANCIYQFKLWKCQMLLILLLHQFEDISDFDLVEITVLLWHSILVKILLLNTFATRLENISIYIYIFMNYQYVFITYMYLLSQNATFARDGCRTVHVRNLCI